MNLNSKMVKIYGIFLALLILWILPIAWRSANATFALTRGIAASNSGLNEIALTYYYNAIEIMPENVAARRLTACDALENENPLVAINHLEYALRVRPDDWLVQRELARAYDAAGYTERANALYAKVAEKELSQAGLNKQLLAKIGDSYFEDGQYEYAFRAYDRFLKNDEYDDLGLLFRDAVLAILANNAKAPELLHILQNKDDNFQIYELGDYLLLNGEKLRRLEPRTLSGKFLMSSEESGVGGFNMVYGEAIAVINVFETGNYQLKAALDASPLPVKMSIGVDHQLLKR